jgi:hypothetical protein
MTEFFQPGQMVGIERTLSADGESNTVDGNRKGFGQRCKLCQRTATIAHVILSMYLDPTDRAGVFSKGFEMLGFVAYTNGVRQPIKAMGRIEHGSAFRSGSFGSHQAGHARRMR